LEAYKKYKLSELGYASVLQAITRLRQACCDPTLVKNLTATQIESLDNPYSDNDIDVEGSLVLPLGVETLLDAFSQAPLSKIAKLLELLSKIRQESPKARFLIFSKFRQYLQTI
jgi:SNF2 family DNA or RNA helicase